MIMRRRPAGGQPSTAPNGTKSFLPDSVTVGTRHLEVDGEWLASLAVVGFPREVYPGWLNPLLTYPGRLDVALHVDPVDPMIATNRLKKQLAKLESDRRRTAEHGRLHDAHIEAATEDAYDLSSRVARGEGKLFRVGLCLTIHASSREKLVNEVAAVRALAASLLLDAKPTSYRSMQGWISTLPLGLDLLGMRRIFDTTALAAAFPFSSADLPSTQLVNTPSPDGVLCGHNLGSQGLVYWDRFSLDNYNSVILGRSGSGKSYFVKLELLRSLYHGTQIYVIDPEDEYRRLCRAVGGAHIRLGSENICFNPFDLPIHTRPDGRRTATKDALTRRSLFLHTVVAVLLGNLTSDQRAALDYGIAATYHRVGITADSRTWTRPPPQLRDLRNVLATSTDPVANELASRLHPYVDGAYKQIFDGQTTTRPDSHLVVFSLRDLPDELKTIGTLLTLDTIWRHVSNPTIQRPRLVVVDEAWLLMKEHLGAQYLTRMAKSFRKHWAGLTVVTQDTADVLNSDLGKAVVTNAATQILLRQAPQAIDEVVELFNLSEGERQFLLSADRGQGLLSSGTHRVAFHGIASRFEHELITSNPAELIDYSSDATQEASEHEFYVDLDVDDDNSRISDE